MELNNKYSEFNETIAPWIGKTAKMLHLYVNGVIQEHHFNITKEQWVVLKILHENESAEGIVQNDLALVTNRNKATLTRLINTMERKNLVARVPSKKDSRKNLIFITKKGEQLFLKIKPIFLKAIEDISLGITEEEIENLIKTMKKLQNNLINFNQ